MSNSTTPVANVRMRGFKLGNRMLLSRQHPSLRTPIGHAIFVRLDPDKCVALKAA